MYEDNKKKGGGKKKGPAESKEQEIKDLDKMPGDEKQMDTPARKKGGAKHHGNMPKKKGNAKHKEGYKGGSKKKPDANGNGVPDYAEDGIGASRKAGAAMGYTQNFGPARQNSYARGAAKVAKIMGYPGAGDHIAGHPAEEIKLDGVTPPGGKATDYAKQSFKDIIKSQDEFDANTTQITRNLAELDSLKKVAQGNKSYAQSLYGPKYNSSMPLDGVHIGKNKSNSGWGGGLTWDQNMNIEKLTKKAKKIQGTRPTLD